MVLKGAGGGCVKPQAETRRGFPFYNIKKLGVRIANLHNNLT